VSFESGERDVRGHTHAQRQSDNCRKEAPEGCKRRAVTAFIWWSLHDGQAHAPFLGYATLPPEVVTEAEEQLKTMSSGGQPTL
jgi:hypothetical protein